MRKKRRRGMGPFGTIALIWVFFAIVMPVVRLSGGLIAAGLAIMASVWAANALRRKAQKAKDKQASEAIPVQYTEVTQKPEAPAAEPSPYSPEVQAIIKEGRVALKEMGRLYASIPNPEIRSRINELMSVSDKIVRDAIDDPADVPQIRKFLDYYLPTTIRLLNAYDRMNAQEYAGENITGSMERIEEMLDTTIVAYKKQLDALFANQAADIQMDIDTMNAMLAREGLGGKSYLDIKDFMKQYEQQQSAAAAAPVPAPESDTSSEQTMKGSTSNG